MKKIFKVAAVSSNTNSFGLKQMVVVAEDGTAYKTCANYLNVKEKGDTITMVDGMFRGCELTEKITKMHKSIVRELWDITPQRA